jgi:hypothetical protein
VALPPHILLAPDLFTGDARMDKETENVMLMIDNNQALFNEVISLIKHGQVWDRHTFHAHVISLFPETYKFAQVRDRDAYNPDVLLFTPSLVRAALNRVDYQLLLDHYRMKIKEGC